MSWLESVKGCLRDINENGRVFPKGSRIEMVFVVVAQNHLLLRTEGPGDINMARLYKGGIEVPIIMSQKFNAVVRRRMLQLLRDFRDKNVDKMSEYVKEASKLGFKKANVGDGSKWNCTIQPPIAESGKKSTDIGMDGYCPACSIFGVALTEQELSINEMQKQKRPFSVGIRSRVRFDPAFATTRSIVTQTHNKVTEGELSTTGQSLFNEIHVEPGTTFIGRMVVTDVTEPELKAILYSLFTTEEIGGRSRIYGTIRVKPLGIRCGAYSATTAYELASEGANQENQENIESFLKEKLNANGFKELKEEDITPQDINKLFEDLWESSLDFSKQVVDWIRKLVSKQTDATHGEQ